MRAAQRGFQEMRFQAESWTLRGVLRSWSSSRWTLGGMCGETCPAVGDACPESS